MPAIFLTINCGQAVSSAFYLARADRTLTLEVPSHSNAWGAVQVQFSATSGTGPWGAYREPGASSAWAWLGAGPGMAVIERPPTPFGRIVLTNSAAIAPTSFTIDQIVR